MIKENHHVAKCCSGKTSKKCSCITSYICRRCDGVCIFTTGFQDLIRTEPSFRWKKYLDEKYFRSEIEAMKDCLKAKTVAIKGTSIDDTAVNEGNTEENSQLANSDDELDKKAQRSRNYKRFLSELEKAKRVSSESPNSKSKSTVLEMIEWYHEQDDEIKKYMKKIHGNGSSDPYRSCNLQGNQVVSFVNHNYQEPKPKAKKVAKRVERDQKMKDQIRGFY